MLGLLLFVFAWFTDTHINSTDAHYNALVDGLADAKTQQVAFAVVTGDLTNFGTNQEVLSYKQAIGTAAFPVYSLSGNHDQKWSQTGGLYFRQQCGDDRFCFDYQGIKYIGIASGPVLRIGADRVTQETLNWLKQKLQEATPGQKIIFLTHQPFTIGTTSIGSTLSDILRPYNVQVILVGHTHSYSKTNYDGIPVIITQHSYDRSYTLVEVSTDSMVFSTRSIGDTTVRLTALPLGQFDYSSTTLNIPRPSYAVNDTYGFVKRRWTFDTGASIYSAPTVAEDRVVVCDASGKIRCLNASKGTLYWMYDAHTLFYSSAVIQNGKVLIGGMDEYVYCLRLSDGALIWKTHLQGGIMATATVYSDTAYVATCVNPRLHALSLSDGSILWSSPACTGHYEAAPLATGSHLFLGSWDGNVRAFNRSDGSVVWTSKLNSGTFYSAASQTPILHRGNIILSIAIGSGANILALDTLTGNIKWRSTERMTQAIGISEDHKNYFFKGFYYLRGVGTDDLNINLTKRWEARHEDRYEEGGSQLMEKNGSLFFCTSRGYAGAVNTETGRMKWQHRVSASSVNTPAPIDQGRVVITTTDGLVYCLEETPDTNTLRLVNYAPPSATQYQAYTYSFTSTGLLNPSYFFIREGDGALPQGLSLDYVTGELKGTPTQSGTFCFTVTISDQDNLYDAQYVKLDVIAGPTGSATIPYSRKSWIVYPNPAIGGKSICIKPNSLNEPVLTGETFLDVTLYSCNGTLIRHIPHYIPSSPIQPGRIPFGYYLLTATQNGKPILREWINAGGD